MKKVILTLVVAFTVTLFDAVVMCQENAKGRRHVPVAQSKPTQNPDADAPAERIGFLRGKNLKAGLEQLRETPVRPRRIEMSGLLGTLRRVPQQYTTIQSGITASVDGDTVLVSEGTYFENIDYSGKRIIVASLYLVDQDTSHISRTIIDGSQATAPQSVVWFISGEDTNSVLCGFTIRGGSGTDIPPTFDERDGGGVILWESSGRLVRNIITANRVTAPNAWGGGVSITGLTNTGQTLIMEDNIISRNIATAATGYGFGGGVSAFRSQFRLTGNVFEYDTVRGMVQAGASGALVYLSSGNLGVIHGNVFRNNIVLGDSNSYACLVIAQYEGEVDIDRNVFEDNSVVSTNLSAFGGAIYVDNLSATSPEKRVTRNVIRRNRLTSNLRYTYGGAMIVWDARVRVADNLIQDNASQAGINAFGGGIYGIGWGGTIENNIVTGNSARYGGGIGHATAPPSGINQVIVNNTVSENVAEFGGGFYGGSNTTSILLNNIFWDDSSSNGEIYAIGSIEAHYSNIEGGWIGGTGNINATPMFADTTYRLANSSPCIGAGRDSVQIGGTWYRSPTRDFGGNSRPMPGGSQPDMGSWENSLGTPTGVGDGQWQLQTTIDGNPPLYSINTVSDRVAWMGSFDTLYRTTDGGADWIPTPTRPTSTEDIVCIEGLSATTAFVGGGGPGSLGGNARIYRTTNGGQNWSVVYTAAGTASYWNAIHFFDAQNGIAHCDPPNPGNSFLIVKTSDGGTTWTPIANQPGANPGEYGLQNMYFYDALHGWFGTGRFDTTSNAGRVFRTIDGGNTWTGHASGNTEVVPGVQFVSPLVGIRISYSSPVLTRSTDGGLTWGPVANLPIANIASMVSATGVNTSNGSQLWVDGFTQTSGRFILTSVDGGATWNEQILPTLPASHLPYLSAVSFGALNDSVRAFGVTINQATFTDGGQVLSYRQRVGYVTGVNEATSLPTEYALSQNYPNPFNPVTNFQFSIANSQLTILKVYDILGREVATLVNEEKQSGIHKVEWNAAGVASGVYFYRLQAGGFVETKKMLLLR